MTNPATDLVVGVDGSASALTAVRWAALFAGQRRRGLRLVHAMDEQRLRYPRTAPAREHLHEMARARGRRVLSVARQVAEDAAPNVEIRLELRREAPMPALQVESRSAGMLVVGRAGLRPLARVLLGSVSVALAAHAACAVAVVRPHIAEDEPPADGPVVVGADGSPDSEDALAFAFEEAAWRKAPLVAVHCWDDGFLAAVFEQSQWKLDRAAVEQYEDELLAQRLSGWQKRYPDVVVDRIVVRGRAAERLLDLADRAQLIVVGSRGRGTLAGALLGSTSQTLLTYALCPVVVARGRVLPQRR